MTKQNKEIDNCILARDVEIEVFKTNDKIKFKLLVFMRQAEMLQYMVDSIGGSQDTSTEAVCLFVDNKVSVCFHMGYLNFPVIAHESVHLALNYIHNKRKKNGIRNPKAKMTQTEYENIEEDLCITTEMFCDAIYNQLTEARII